MFGKLISIHVPLAGDDKNKSPVPPKAKISIHVPLAGDDLLGLIKFTRNGDFYPRPPCGGRRMAAINWPSIDQFLSTSPLRGTTPTTWRTRAPPRLFLSTSPLRGTTGHVQHGVGVAGISIHVPLAGDDIPPLRRCIPCRSHFYPRPPCGGRLGTVRGPCQPGDFYPRPPCGGRRSLPGSRAGCSDISIHVPLAGDDGAAAGRAGLLRRISIHVPLAGDDQVATSSP